MRRVLFSTAITLCLAGCGTYVPEMREWPRYEQADTQDMINAIVRSVQCELRTAITDVVDNDLKESRGRVGGRTYSGFLSDWGAEVALTFTIVEKSESNPSAIWSPPSPATALFSLAGSLSLSSQATRVEKMNFFYTVRDLYGVRCNGKNQPYFDSFLIKSDLKIADLLLSRMTPAITQNGRLPIAGDKNVLSHQVSFQVVTGGGITPSWQLVRVSVNPAGSFLGASRDRTHDLLITFGPLDRARGGRSLIAIAEQSHFSSQITSGISNGFRSALVR